MEIFTKASIEPPVAVMWDEALLKYDFGPHHPMKPLRLDLTSRMMRGFGLYNLENVSLLKPRFASDDELSDAHAYEYIAAVRQAGQGIKDLRRGLGSEDMPLFPSIHSTSALLCGGSMLAADAIISGEATRAFNFSGGMHHASRNKASGFCVYNDPAVAIYRFLDAGYSKVVYIDIDAHHGDGTQSIFWQDERVMTISIHESGKTLFPGTGEIFETGARSSVGTSVNIPLPAHTNDTQWLRAFHAIVPPLVEAFEPEIIVSQHGCDAHHADPLSNLNLSIEAMGIATMKIRDLSAKLCENKWLATGGGGYNIVDVVPRAWSHVLSVVANKDLPFTTSLPELWVDHVKASKVTTVDLPKTLGDQEDVWWRSWEVGYDFNNPFDKIILNVRKSIFPLYDLDPWFE